MEGDRLDDGQKRALEEIRTLVGTSLRPSASGAEPEALLAECVRALHETSERYDWTGVYLRQGEELVLHAYLGRPTPHVRIHIDTGICGAAVREDATIVVPDVRADPRYLACSLETRSEIVVPIRSAGEVIGEIDIDSDAYDAFSSGDRAFLEEAARIIGAALVD
jgi:GAF domain-containing protein